MAKAKSTDPSADDGGFMGKLDPATLRPELRDALQGLGPGQLTGVIKIPAGYAILQILPEEQSTAGIGMSSSQMLPLTASQTIGAAISRQSAKLASVHSPWPCSAWKDFWIPIILRACRVPSPQMCNKHITL